MKTCDKCGWPFRFCTVIYTVESGTKNERRYCSELCCDNAEAIYEQPTEEQQP